MFRKATTFVAAALAFGAAYGTTAQADSEVEALKQRVAELEKSNAANRAEAGKTYMEGRRADEVKSMIAEVLEDSESRRSLSASGAVAGHDGGFFLASADNKFRMEISGKIVIRFIANFREDVTTGTAGTDEHEVTTGFENYETEVGFSGHVFSEDIIYGVTLEIGDDLDVGTDSIYIGYTGFFDGLEVVIGYGMEVNIDLENATSSTRQNAVDRSYVSKRIDDSGGDGDVGIAASYEHDMFRVFASFQNAGTSNWEDNNAYMLDVRVEVKLMGSWKQYKDMTSWSGDDVMLVVGGGVRVGWGADQADYPGDEQFNDSDWVVFGWAADARFEWNGLSIWIAGMGYHGNASDGASFDIYGIVGTVAYNIMDTVELFVRGEGLIADNQANGVGYGGWDRDGGVAIVTIGGTWFFYKDKLKLTADVGFATDDIANADASRGYLANQTGDDSDIQVVVRVQVILKF